MQPHSQSRRKPRICSIRNDQVILHEVGSRVVERHQLPVNFDVGGVCVELTPTTLLCMCGFPASRNVYELDLTTLHIRPWPSLCVPRDWPGALKLDTYVYVLGGQLDSATLLCSCEKMNLSDQQWTILRSEMTYPRLAFTPCLCNSLVYLLSADTDAIETFDPHAEVFTLLSVTLPGDLELDTLSVTFCLNGELCLLTGNMQMLRWCPGSAQEPRLCASTEGCWSHSQPLIVDSHVVIVYDANVMYFDLVTYTFTRTIS